MDFKDRIIISTYYSEIEERGRAEVFFSKDAYSVAYIDNDGELLCIETYHGKSLRYAEDAAENWALGIK